MEACEFGFAQARIPRPFRAEHVLRHAPGHYPGLPSYAPLARHRGCTLPPVTGHATSHSINAQISSGLPAENPPSTTSACPVTHDDRLESRNSPAFATSSRLT